MSMNKMKFARNIGLAQFLVLSPFFSSVSADDTEIFFNIERDVSAPNILFILDNSGSMSTNVEVLSADFDPSQSYNGGLNRDDVYYIDGSRRYRISRSALQCQDIEGKLSSIGKTSAYRM